MRGATGITLQPHQILHLPRKIAIQNLEASFTMADDSSMIPTCSEHEIAKLNPPVRRGYFSRLGQRILYAKLQHFALRLSIQISPNTAPATKSDIATSPNIVPATKKDTAKSPKFHLPRKVTLRHHQILPLPQKVTLQHHQICTCHEE